MADAPTRRQLAGRSVYFELLHTHDRLQGEFAQLFKQRGLTHAQFNVLRILRGGGAEGLTCQQIGERLIDRRVVVVRLTDEGRSKVDELDVPVLALHERQVAHLSTRELEDLTALLARLRQPPA